MYVFQCENSLDGILTGVYDAWDSRLGHKNIQLSSESCGEILLFHEYISVNPDLEKSQKVSKTLIRRLGMSFFEVICKCAMADGNCRKLTMDKANAVYQAIVMALALPEGAKVLEYLAEPCISCIFELCRQTNNEAHYMIEFLRFPLENFLLYDAVHQIAAVHKAQKRYMIVDANELNLDIIKRYSQEEQEYRRLWTAFFDTIAIDERINPKLQSQNIPKRYWRDTVELKSKY